MWCNAGTRNTCILYMYIILDLVSLEMIWLHYSVLIMVVYSRAKYVVLFVILLTGVFENWIS